MCGGFFLFLKALTNASHAGPQMSLDSPFSTNISPSVTSRGWHSFANPVKRGGTAGRIYYHGVWHLDLPSAGHAKPGQSNTAVNLRQKLFSSVENSAQIQGDLPQDLQCMACLLGILYPESLACTSGWENRE